MCAMYIYKYDNLSKVINPVGKRSCLNGIYCIYIGIKLLFKIKNMNSRPLSIIKVAVASTIVFFGIIIVSGISPSIVFAALTSPVVTPVNLVSDNASTTLAKVGDVVTLTFTTSTTTLVSPTVSIFSHATTTAIETVIDTTNSLYTWAASTTMATGDLDGSVSLFATVGNSDGSATTSVTTTTDNSAVRFDKTPPTLNSIAWSDVDGSTNISGTDTLVLTFSETMATTTLTTSNLDTALALTNSHTFGTSANGLAISWNIAGTILTVTLGSDTTIVSGDTLDPASTITDAVGNADATATAIVIADNLAPNAPIGLGSYVFHSYRFVSLSSFGSSQIRYTIDGTSPSCSVGTVYSSTLKISTVTTLKAIGCDVAGNSSAIITAQYNPAVGDIIANTITQTITTLPVKTVVNVKSSVTGKIKTSVTAKKPLAATNPSGLSESQVQAIVSLLKSFGSIGNLVINNVTNSLRGTVASVGASVKEHIKFVNNMHIGTRGGDVLLLQKYLDKNGFIVSKTGAGSLGNETTMFGFKTRAALIRYQKSRNISPAVGYFGPKTRAEINIGE